MAREDKRIKRKVRNSYLISTVSIALVLFLLGSVSYLILNALSATDRLKESVTIYVMLKDGLSEQETADLRKQIETKESVREVKYITKEQAAEDFRAYIGNDFEEFLDENPLPNSFEVGLTAEASEKEAIRSLEKELTALTGIDEVIYQKGIIEQIGSNINKFNLILLLFGGALLFIALILLNNTIRMTIVAKRHIINTMKLVGATRGFILRPFLASATAHGIYAGAIASIMFIAMVAGLGEGLPEVRFLKDNMLLLGIVAAMIIGGIIISLLFTLFAVNKFVRMPSGNAYLY